MHTITMLLRLAQFKKVITTASLYQYDLTNNSNRMSF